jgi:hypothetical protein
MKALTSLSLPLIQFPLQMDIVNWSQREFELVIKVNQPLIQKFSENSVPGQKELFPQAMKHFTVMRISMSTTWFHSRLKTTLNGNWMKTLNVRRASNIWPSNFIPSPQVSVTRCTVIEKPCPICSLLQLKFQVNMRGNSPAETYSVIQGLYNRFGPSRPETILRRVDP